VILGFHNLHDEICVEIYKVIYHLVEVLNCTIQVTRFPKVLLPPPSVRQRNFGVPKPRLEKLKVVVDVVWPTEVASAAKGYHMAVTE
jgi:hypothetical protein